MLNNAITNVDDNRLAGLIDHAQQRVLFVSPGVSDPVAAALVRAWQRLGTERVQVILDPDAEVMRLGYGTFDGLQALSDAARFMPRGLDQQPGVRIGVLVADGATMVYAPTPLLIEVEAADPGRPNAILLTGVPGDVAAELGLGPEGAQSIGTAPLSPQTVDAVRQDLEVAPPVKFDLARRVRVFTTRFQFVELEMTGCFISRRKVPIPSSLVGLTRNKEVERQFHAHYDLVQRGKLEVKVADRIISERSLLDRRRDIDRKYLIQLRGYGSVVLRANKATLETVVGDLRAEVETFAKGVKAALDEQMKVSQHELAAALLPAVKDSPPAEFTKFHGPHPPGDFLLKKLRDDIAAAFGTADSLVKAMEVRLIFKDVAYESLVDPEFLAVARKAIPSLEALHEEHDALSLQERQART
ncbi:MAG: hypothetical protein AB1625_10430 [Acidobacteriota bacterium]